MAECAWCGHEKSDHPVMKPTLIRGACTVEGCKCQQYGNKWRLKQSAPTDLPDEPGVPAAEHTWVPLTGSVEYCWQCGTARAERGAGLEYFKVGHYPDAEPGSGDVAMDDVAVGLCSEPTCKVSLQYSLSDQHQEWFERGAVSSWFGVDCHRLSRDSLLACIGFLGLEMESQREFMRKQIEMERDLAQAKDRLSRARKFRP